jgi:hypothetical protein
VVKCPISVRTLCLFALVFAIGAIANKEANAQAPQITLSVSPSDPNGKIVYGCGSIYKVSAPPAPWQNNGAVTYYYRQLDTVSRVPSNWQTYTGGQSWSIIEGTPGRFEAYAKVPLATQQTPSQPQQQKITVQTATITVVVGPPDKITLPGPAQANWNQLFNGQGQTIGFATVVVPLTFPVTCQGITPTSLPNATLLEDITGRVAFGLRHRDKHDVKITLGGIAGVNLTDQKSITLMTKDTPDLLTVTDFGAVAIGIRPVRRRSGDSATSPRGNDAG